MKIWKAIKLVWKVSWMSVTVVWVAGFGIYHTVNFFTYEMFHPERWCDDWTQHPIWLLAGWVMIGLWIGIAAWRAWKEVKEEQKKRKMAWLLDWMDYYADAGDREGLRRCLREYDELKAKDR